MADLEVNFVLENQPEIEADFSIEMSNNEHDLLINRDLPDQHPISAITGLEEALAQIPTDYVSDSELEVALLEKQDVLTAGTGISIVGNVISNTQTSANWGNITGVLSNQTDLQNALNLKANIADIPTATSQLTNDSGFITSAALTGYATESYVDSGLSQKQNTLTANQLNAVNSGITSALVGQISTNAQAITTEATNRENADTALQSQIDAITASSDVTDIVGTYAQLQTYDTSTLAPNSIIKVLQDENRNNETTYYRWVITGGVGSWVLIGEEGPYYTKSEADSAFVPQSRTINGQALSANVTLTASDVGATTQSYVDARLSTKQDIISDLATIRSGAALGATAVQPSALNGYATQTWVGQQGYITGITSSDVTSALGYTPYDSENPNGFITSSALAPYATTSYVDSGLSGKQETLVSGTNIKTVNNQSLLGSGNIEIQGGADVEAFTAAEVQAIWEAN